MCSHEAFNSDVMKNRELKCFCAVSMVTPVSIFLSSKYYTKEDNDLISRCVFLLFSNIYKTFKR